MDKLSLVATAKEQTRKAAASGNGRAATTVYGGHDHVLRQTRRQAALMHDLRDRADVEALLRAFYDRAFTDPLLRHVFVDVVRMDLDAHVPLLVGFWEKVLFGTGGYDGRVMHVHREAHRRVPLTDEHFSRWLEIWRETLDALFEGPVAEAADAHARRMAAVFLRQLTEPRRTLPVVPSGR